MLGSDLRDGRGADGQLEAPWNADRQRVQKSYLQLRSEHVARSCTQSTREGPEQRAHLANRSSWRSLLAS